MRQQGIAGILMNLASKFSDSQEEMNNLIGSPTMHIWIFKTRISRRKSHKNELLQDMGRKAS